IEGLLMYLTGMEIDRLFSALKPARRIVFTQMEPDRRGRSAFHNATPLVTGVLSLWREPFKSTLRREDAARFLERFGLALRDVATSDTLRSRYLAGRAERPLAQGEMVVTAER